MSLQNPREEKENEEQLKSLFARPEINPLPQFKSNAAIIFKAHLQEKSRDRKLKLAQWSFVGISAVFAVVAFVIPFFTLPTELREENLSVALEETSKLKQVDEVKDTQESVDVSKSNGEYATDHQKKAQTHQADLANNRTNENVRAEGTNRRNFSRRYIDSNRHAGLLRILKKSDYRQSLKLLRDSGFLPLGDQLQADIEQLPDNSLVLTGAVYVNEPGKEYKELPVDQALICFYGKVNFCKLSSSQGLFKADGLIAGDYQIEIKKDGYELEAKEISMKESLQNQKFFMRLSNVKELALTGHVRYRRENFVPLESASVCIGGIGCTQTNSLGYFYLAVKKEGKYSLVVNSNKADLKIHTEEVTINQLSVVDVTLDPIGVTKSYPLFYRLTISNYSANSLGATIGQLCLNRDDPIAGSLGPFPAICKPIKNVQNQNFDFGILPSANYSITVDSANLVGSDLMTKFELNGVTSLIKNFSIQVGNPSGSLNFKLKFQVILNNTPFPISNSNVTVSSLTKTFTTNSEGMVEWSSSELQGKSYQFSVFASGFAVQTFPATVNFKSSSPLVLNVVPITPNLTYSYTFKNNLSEPIVVGVEDKGQSGRNADSRVLFSLEKKDFVIEVGEEKTITLTLPEEEIVVFAYRGANTGSKYYSIGMIYHGFYSQKIILPNP